MIVVFDAFGTLLKANNRTNPYGRLNRKLPSNMHRQFMTTNKSLEDFCVELGQHGLYPSLQSLLTQELKDIELFADVSHTLQRLRAKGMRIGLCSNLAQGYGQRVMDLLPSLDAYTLSYEVGARKPEPEIYAHVCQALGCKPKDVMFVGDSENADVLGPKAFGMKSFHLNRDAGIKLDDFLKSIGA